MGRRAGVVEIDVEPNLKPVGGKIDAFARTLQPLGIRTELVSSLGRDLHREAASGQQALDAINTKKAQDNLTALGGVGEKQLGRIGSAAKLSNEGLVAIGAGGIFAGSKMLSALKPAVDAASDLNEAISYSNQVFGSSSQAIESWAGTAASKLGQSKRAAIEAATDFATFGKAAGLSGGELVGFSEQLTQLATDLASAKNTTPEEAVLALGAALRGETEPIRKYGVLIDDAAIKQQALADGMIKTTKDALTPHQRVLAVNSLLFKQTKDAQGDFSRTSDGVANSQRKLNAEMEDTKAKLGDALLPVVAAGTKAVAGFLDVLDKIPGATTALGIGIAGLGGAAILGGGISAAVGGLRALQELRSGIGKAGADAATGMTAAAGAATEATAATTTTAAAMEGVAVASTEAGVAGSAALGGITAEAIAATGALGAAATAMGALGAGAQAIALGPGVPTATPRVGSNLPAVVGSNAPAISPSGIKIDANVMDLQAIDDDLLAIESGGAKAEKAMSGVAAAAADVGSAAGRTSPLLGRLSSGLQSIGSGISGFREGLNGLGGFGKFAAGAAAASVAVEGFTSAYSQLQEQAAEGIKGLTQTPDEFIAAFDPSKPEKYTVAVAEAGTAISQLIAVGDQDAWDKIQSFFGIGGDDWEDRAKLARSTIDSVKQAIDQLPADQATRLVDSLAAKVKQLGDPTGEAAGMIQELYDAIAEKASVEAGTAALQDLGSALEVLGVKIDENQSRWDRYSTVLGGIFAPGQAAIEAERAFQDGQQAVTDAQQNLDDILAGNTEGLRTARKEMEAARDALNAAVARTGPGSRAARDAAHDVRSALREYRDLLIEAGRTNEGDFFNDRRQDLLDAYDRILEAQQKLTDIESGNSEEVTSARQRLADAESRYSEELGKTGANSKEAAKAAEDLRRKQEDMIPLLVERDQAEAEFQEQLKQHPEALQASLDKIDEWQQQGLISIAVAEAWKQKLLEVAAAAATVNTSTPGTVGYSDSQGYLDNEHRAGATTPRQPSRPPSGDVHHLTVKAANKLGFPLPAQFNFADQHMWVDGKGHHWFYQKRAEDWIAYYALGGLVGGVGGGDVVPAMLTPGEVVMSKAAVNRYGADNLLAMNAGQTPSGGDVVAEVRALRGDLVTTIRLIARSISPGAGEELAPLLRSIERNTRCGTVPTTRETIAERRLAESEFVK